MDWQAVGAVGGAVAGFCALATLLVFVLRALYGVMLRFDQQDRELAAIKHEMFPNSGASMRDAVDRATVLSEANAKELKRLHRRITSIEKHQKSGGKG